MFHRATEARVGGVVVGGSGVEGGCYCCVVGGSGIEGGCHCHVVGGSGVKGGCHCCVVGGSGIEGGCCHCMVGLYSVMTPSVWVEVLFFSHMAWWNTSPHSILGRLEQQSRCR
jgi:hypothetical protein